MSVRKFFHKYIHLLVVVVVVCFFLIYMCSVILVLG